MEIINEASTGCPPDRDLLELLTPEVPRKDEKSVANLRQLIPDIEIFNIHRKIGYGTFSSVFLGSLKCQERTPIEQKKLFAIKHVVPTSHPNRIERELRCMRQIGGASNVVGVELCLRRQESVAFVMPYIAHDPFHHYFDKMSPTETQLYMKNLLVALKRVHEFSVIHRDVKPSNFLYNRKQQKFLLVDFGLAQDISHRSKVPTTGAGSVTVANNASVKRRLSGVSGEEATQPTSDATQQQQKKLKLADNLENSTTTASDEQGGSAVQQQPPPVFKTPLKQSNQIISPMKLSNITKDLYSSPLVRQVKLTVLGISSNIKLAQRQQQQQQQGTINNVVAVSTNPPKTVNGGQATLRGSKSELVCECFGKSQVCNICLVKKEMQASRAGTPGYRPPEVLLKYPDQTTAVDIWAAGVVLLSILSRVYPFFKNSDDLHSLAEIISVFGDQRVKKTAGLLGRHIKTARKQPLDLRKLCMRLRSRFRHLRARQQQTGEPVITFANRCDNCEQQLGECICEHSEANRDFAEDEYSADVYDLLYRLLEINPHHRISADEALKHPYFQRSY